MKLRYRTLFATTAAALGLAVVGPALATSFNFDYQASGDRSITPYQVFDDGQSTYLQFRQGTRIPNVMVVDAKGNRSVMELTPEGPYHRINVVAAQIHLVGERTSASLSSSRVAAKQVAAPVEHRAQTVAEAAPSRAEPVAQAPVQQQYAGVQYAPVQHPARQQVVSQPAYERQNTVAQTAYPRQQAVPVYDSAVYQQQVPAYAAPAPVQAPQYQQAAHQPVAQPGRSDEVRQLREEVSELKQLLSGLLQHLQKTSGSAPMVQRGNTGATNVQVQPAVQKQAQPAPQSTPAVSHGVQQHAQPQLIRASNTVTPNPVVQDAVVAPAPAPQVVRPTPTSQHVQAPQPAPVVTAPYEISVASGQRLSDAIRRFVNHYQLDLDWDTGGADYEVKFGFKVAGGTFEDVLYSALSPFKLSAVRRTGNGVVAVTRAT